MTSHDTDAMLHDRRADGTAIDVLGIGNALVDVLSHEEAGFVEAQSLTKGAMTLIEADRATALYDAMGPAIEVSGGSAANTIAGIASFGGRAAYLGKVADDQLGAVFGHDMRANGVLYRSASAVDGLPTGRCLIVVTPDADRTMSTFLGASSMFGPEDVDAELVEASRITYLEGYLFDRPEAKAAYRRASEIAHEAGRRVAITLSDTFCVERHLDEWRPMISDHVDILFANEGEIIALFGTDLDRALDHLRDEVEIGCVTLGPHGSVIVAGSETITIAAEPVAHVVDTTGAGDLYAAGVLHGVGAGLALDRCGRLGSVAAAAVIAHTGARPEAPLHLLV